jgi:hypothetical protein
MAAVGAGSLCCVKALLHAPAETGAAAVRDHFGHPDSLLRLAVTGVDGAALRPDPELVRFLLLSGTCLPEEIQALVSGFGFDRPPRNLSSDFLSTRVCGSRSPLQNDA